jgi:membrane peptidoglycan carboxypeptidase
MKKKYFKILIFCISFLFFFSVAFLAIIYHEVSRDASGRIERGVIDQIIFSESPVYYDDGQTPIGVFFEKTHRKYIHFNDIPKPFIKALVAAEDGHFFNHPGFDLKAILRALMANIRAGKIVQGGSTLTQQTAKNIFKRQKRSYLAKLRELFQALLLEKKYTKEEILEMYANQFFVTGFGRGIRIASQFYFDKEAEALDLVESAFIAGSVKGPNRYNPFTKKTEAEKMEAMRLAKLRKDYVIGNMMKMGFITKEKYLEAREREIPFKEGKVTYSLNVILDYIREQLESNYFRSILQEQGLANIATSGIKVYTTVNKEIQEGALRSMRRHLPLLDVKLSGYNRDLLQEKYMELAEDTLLEKPENDMPFPCRITQINTDTRNPSIIVAWDSGGGIIDYDGIKPTGEAWLKWKLGNWAVFDKNHVPDFLENFQVGDLVPVRLMETPGKDGHTRLMLSKIPELEGGIIVLKKGMIKAMIGGFFDRFFNRAVDAKRQLGSIFKPLVYAAAFQLNWNSLDPLRNMKDMFRFERTFYVPKPDHDPESNTVSITWAGVKSENLATVWLLYHLTDRLNMSEFQQVVELVGLNRKSGESYREYVGRIRDKHGVVVSNEALMEAAFEESKKEIESDLIFSGHETALNNINRLHFSVDTKELALQNQDEAQIQRRSFQRLRSLNFDMKRKFERITHLLNTYKEKGDPNVKETLSGALHDFYLVETGNQVPRLIYAEPEHQWTLPDLYPITAEWIIDQTEPMSMEEVWIDDLIPSGVVDLLQLYLKKNYRRLLNHKRYDLEVLSKVRDFKTLVNLLYVTHLGEKMGIFTRLDPVLSFPLGANSISIMDAALAYHTIMSGHFYPVSDMIFPDMVPIITKIVDREGETIWEYVPQPKQILTNRVSGLVTEILRMVVQKGTARTAKDAIRLSTEMENEKLHIPIPSFGKTGTANRFINSSFVGFIPGPNENSGQLDIQEGYVLASYVGYDDNRPMKGENVTIYGASGALPLWIETANALINSRHYKANLQVADLVFDDRSIPIMNNEGLQPIMISTTTGLPLWPEDENSLENSVRVFSDVDFAEDTLRLNRAFEPITGVDYERKTEH